MPARVRPGLEQAMRFDESGRHILPGTSIPMASVISVAQAESDDASTTYSAASAYPTEYFAAVGIGYRKGARDVVTFSAQHYGYGRFTIEHNYVHHDDDITTHYATTSFSINSILSVTTREIAASEYSDWCLTQGARIQHPEQAVRLLDMINFVRVRCYFPGYSEYPPMMANSMSAAKRLADANPFATLLEHAEGRLRFPSVRHMLSPIECAFTDPDPAVSQFDSLAERSVKLAYAIRGEHDFENALNVLAYKRPHKAFAVDLVTARTENEHTGKVYRTACFIHLPNPQNYDLLPKEGQTGWMITNVPFRMDDAPSRKLTETQIVLTLIREITESAWLARQIRGSDEDQLADIRAALDRIILPAQPGQDNVRTNFIRIKSKDLRYTRATTDESEIAYLRRRMKNIASELRLSSPSIEP
ncbi:hypothetical protein DL765_005339 [Monosporascus sp. GIB2]|nr:hypothetical protein DL765_005339 [Monosporascus sp. GIB2]